MNFELLKKNIEQFLISKTNEKINEEIKKEIWDLIKKTLEGKELTCKWGKLWETGYWEEEK